MKPHADITFSSLKGDITQKGPTNIEIYYKPSLASTAICEVKFTISEFDFEPISTLISGSGMHLSPKRKKKIMQITSTPSIPEQPPTVQKEIVQESNIEPSLASTKAKILLGQKPKRPPSAKLKKLDQKYEEPTKLITQRERQREEEREMISIDKGISKKLLNKETEFICKYSQTEKFMTEKDIKFFQCIGDTAISEAQRDSVSKDRVEELEFKQQWIHNKNITNYAIKKDNGPVVVPTDFRTDLTPQWDLYSIDIFSYRNFSCKKIQEAGTRAISASRVIKYTEQIKNKLREVRKLLGKRRNQRRCC